jgi:hypothetical protein
VGGTEVGRKRHSQSTETNRKNVNGQTSHGNFHQVNNLLSPKLFSGDLNTDKVNWAKTIGRVKTVLNQVQLNLSVQLNKMILITFGLNYDEKQ